MLDNNNSSNDKNSSQIFKSNIPINILFELLDKICVKNENYYVLNNGAYKKGIFTGDIQQFIQDCTPYYFISKRKYLTRQLNYNHFITIIRQICKHLNIKYTNKIKYERSTYDIIYNIYFNS
jgi:hypothetical protein